ncbi:N-6 DNA methylase [Burkholderia vietnamiensis]|uniref:N-6 DNA methylase n=1 Tax=Burkholderia vietnamiensis TaxID=60552 RepID=UPI0007C82E8C|nr:N-6 DNA methylase [Burkholderia vietnamiensis]
MRKTTKTQHQTTPGAGFTKRIERFAQRNPIRSSAKAIVDDIVQLQFNTLSSALPLAYAGTGVAWFDDRHLIALNEYRDHPEAWAELVALSVEYQNLVAASAPFTDLLSDFYSTLIAPEQAKAQAQYMTPTYLADMVMRFTLSKSLPLRAGEPNMAGDPTCGSGALLLAHLRHRFETFGKATLACTYVVGNDRDPAMMKLATVQIALSSLAHGLPLGGLMLYRADLITEYMTDNTLAVAVHPNVEQAIAHGRRDDVAAALKAVAAKSAHLTAMGRAVAALKAAESRPQS